MLGKQITFWLIWGTVVTWIVWDIVVAACWGVTATESMTMMRLGHAHPIIAFACGVLMGHFFWNQSPDYPLPEVVHLKAFCSKVFKS